MNRFILILLSVVLFINPCIAQTDNAGSEEIPEIKNFSPIEEKAYGFGFYGEDEYQVMGVRYDAGVKPPSQGQLEFKIGKGIATFSLVVKKSDKVFKADLVGEKEVIKNGRKVKEQKVIGLLYLETRITEFEEEILIGKLHTDEAKELGLVKRDYNVYMNVYTSKKDREDLELLKSKNSQGGK